MMENMTKGYQSALAFNDCLSSTTFDFVVPARQTITPETSNLYEIITGWGLGAKLAYSGIKKAGVPASYEEDALQEIYIDWMNLVIDDERDKGTICSYANTIAYTTALRVKRDLAGPIRLPGNAFKTKGDGSTYVEAGHLAAPLNFEEDLSEVVASELLNSAYAPNNALVDEAELLRRLEFIDNDPSCSFLTKKQRAICKGIVIGKNIYELEGEMGIMNVTIMRTLRNIRSVFNAQR